MARPHVRSFFSAKGVKVRFKRNDFGAGQPVWHEVEKSPVVLGVPPGGVEAEVECAPSLTGRTCMLVEIYHIEDINQSHNKGQENCEVGPTSSPAEGCFVLGNPTQAPTSVRIALRQLIRPAQQEAVGIRERWIRHLDPQVTRPGEEMKACVIIGPKSGLIPPGQQAESSLTGFINGTVVGGVNFIMTKT